MGDAGLLFPFFGLGFLFGPLRLVLRLFRLKAQALLGALGFQVGRKDVGNIVDQNKAHDVEPVFVGEAGFELLAVRNSLSLCGVTLCHAGILSDPLSGEVILDQGGGEHDDRQNAHHHKPVASGALAHTQEKTHHNGHDNGGQNTGDHGDAGGGQHSKIVPLAGIPGGQGHHQGMTHVVDREGE